MRALLAAAFLCAGPAFAHDAPTGWSYPFACCSGLDCREIGANQSEGRERVIESPEGYRFATSGEIVPYTDKRIKDSPDGAYHWCTEAGKSDGRTICLFVPPRAF